MEERQATIDGTTYPMRSPFIVMATQNPVEHEGTYRLPEAQLDRFMFNVWLDYPKFTEELQVVKLTTANIKVELNKILNAQEIVFFQDLIRKIPVADNVIEYAVKLVNKTRLNSEYTAEVTKKYLQWGAGPRASQYLIIGAKAHAAINGKYSPDIEDVKAIATPILRHRIVLNYKAEAEGVSVEDIIKQLL
jgi:MoxR-like ATPase